MKCLGGRFYQSKYICPIINKCMKLNHIDICYDPMCGALHLIGNVLCKERYASDIDADLIAFYQYLKEGGQPPAHLDKATYEDARDHPEKYDQWYLGAIKTNATFGGLAWGDYGPELKFKGMNQYEKTVSLTRSQMPQIKKINFDCKDYRDVDYPDGCFIIFDPPELKFKKLLKDEFDYDALYHWIRSNSDRYWIILCEKEGPDDFDNFFTVGNV